MAYSVEHGSQFHTFVANEDIEQYIPVKLTTDGTLDVCDTHATDKPIGVAQDDAEEGQECLVMVQGITKVQAHQHATAGAINEADLLTTGSDGRAQATTTGNDFVFGIALTAVASADSERLVTARINTPPYRY